MSKIKVAICQHCNSIVIGASMPLAETDRDSRKDFFNAAKQGLIIDMITLEEWQEGKDFGHKEGCKFYTV